MESSYKHHHIDKDITKLVKKLKPKHCYEFGVYEGYSTLAILKGIQKRWGVKAGATLKAYDLWEEYEFKHAELQSVRSGLMYHDDYYQLTVDRGDFYEWIKDVPKNIDFLHLDISNDGNTIETAVEGLPSGTHLLFEGGSEERDNVDWMIRYNKRPIRSIKYKYQVINENFPSISYLQVP